MEIYIQEVSSVLFLSRLQDQASQRILEVMRLFPEMLAKAELFEACGYPAKTWFSLAAVGQAFSPQQVG